MKKEKHGGSPLAGLTVAAILLASTAGYVSALSGMFQSPLMIEEATTDFLGDDTSDAQTAGQEKTATFRQTLGRTAAAWLINALPGYSSARARELWYLSLDSSGERRLSIETSGSYNAPVATTYTVFNPSLFNNLAPASGFAGPKTSTPTLEAATDQTWKNSVGNTNFNDGASWTSGVPPGVGDRAIFATTGGSAAINAQPNLTVSVSIANLDFSQSTTSGYDLTSNNTSITLTLTSTLTTSGNQAIVASNSSGTNTVDAPIILGGGPGTTQTFSIASGGTFVINGVISESGAGTKISKTGSGILTLTNANGYTGGTALTAGTIAIGSNTALGSGTLTFSNGTTLQSADANARTISNVWAYGTTGNIFGATGTGDLTLSDTSGTYSLGSTSKTWTVNNTKTTLAAPFSSTGSLIKDGPGMLILSGASTYSGKTIISNGAISASTFNNVSGGTASSNLGHPTTAANGTIDIGSTINTGQLTYTGTGQTTDRVINLAGTTGGATLDDSGTGTLTFSSDFTATGVGAKTLTLQGSTAGVGVISGKIVDNLTGTNNTSVTKTGSGTWQLGGANSYSGLTTVSQGTLQINVNGALGATTNGTTVSNGAVLKLNGVNYSTAEGLSLNGSGISGGGALTNSGTSSYAGAITLGTSSTINAGGGALTLSGGIAKNGVTLTLTGGGTITISTAGITGSSPSSDLIVDGVTVNENVANSYNGATFIRNGGILNANVVNALPTANGRTALTMDDTGTGSSQLVLAANQSAASLTSPTSTSLINLNANTLTIGTSSGSTNFAGSIQGTGALIKDGASTQTLSGNNSYTGGTTISAGTITAGSATAIGNGALTFDNGSTGTFQLNGNNISVTDLVFNQTNTGSPIVENASATPATFTVNPNVSGVAFAGVLRDGSGGGALSLTINGGLLVLYNTNTYTGPTTINAGGLTFNSNTSPNISGSANNSTIFLGSFTTINSPTATLTLGGNSPNTITSPITLLPSAGGTQGTRLFNSTAVSGTNTYGGILTMNTGLTLESSTGGTFLFQGGSINLKGNALTVDSQANFNGADSAGVRGKIVINELLTTTNGSPGGLIKDGGGTLILQNVNNNYTGTSVFDVFSNTVATRIAGGTLGIYADTSLGLAPANPGADNIYFDPSAASNPTADHILQATGGDISLSARRQISVANGLTGTFDSNGNTFTVNGVIHGSGAIATTTGVNANGTVIFTNGNTYAGGTTVQSGTLLVNNPAATSGTGSGAVTVNSGGTLGGNGFINTGSNNVAINGTVNPGAAANTTGALTLTTASTVFGSTGVFHVDIGGSAFDQLLTSGTFDLTALGDTISFNVTAPLTEGSYQLATFNGLALGFFDNANTPSGYTLVYNLGELDLIATPVPEPSTWIGAALALGAVAFTQRRRLRSYSLRRIRPSANLLSVRGS